MPRIRWRAGHLRAGLNTASERIGRRLMLLAVAFIVIQGLVLTLSPAVRARSWSASLRFSHWAANRGMACRPGSAAAVAGATNDRFAIPSCFPICALLSGWGLLTIWRLDPSFGQRQAAWLAISAGLVAWLGGKWGDLGVLRRYRSILLAAGFVLTALTIVLGTSPTGIGPRLWLGCCGIYLQPSEPLKLLMVVYLAAYLADQVDPKGRLFPMLLPTLVIAGLALLLLLVQRDLGSASILIMLFTIILYTATGRKRVLLATLIALGLAARHGLLLHRHRARSTGVLDQSVAGPQRPVLPDRAITAGGSQWRDPRPRPRAGEPGAGTGCTFGFHLHGHR